MRNIITIFKREIKAFFNSPIAYIFIIVFLLISGGVYMTEFFIISIADMRRFFYALPLILCVFLPAVTMRLWAEDRKGNTLELLLTFPVKTQELVMGKFLASLVFYITALLSTVTIPIMIAILGKPDIGIIICQYIGAILVGSLFLSIGIFVSGFCKDQIVSLIIGMVACFGLFLLGTDFTAGSIDGWIPGLGSFLRSSLGLTQHFSAFNKGVIDIRDVLYIVIGTAIFLALNTFWLETRLKPKSKTFFTTAVLISVAIFALFNFIFSDMPIGRADLTEGKMYTISKATKEILQGLKAPATAKLFISSSDKMPTGMKNLERDIRDKLDELKVASKGNFDYKVFHMEAANVTQEGQEESLEKSIEKKGIRPFQVQSIEADELGVKLIYSAISIAYKEKPEEVIPRITADHIYDLEYIVISTIYKMTLAKKPSVALVAPYEERFIDPSMKQILASLGQDQVDKLREDEYEFLPKLLEYEGYTVSRIKLTQEEPIPAGTNTLIIIEPRDLNERQRFEINRFLVNGGSVFMAVQRYNFEYSSFSQQGIRVASVDKNPQVEDILEKWGLGVSKDFLMDSQVDIVSLTGSKLFGVIPISAPVKLPIQVKIISDQMNKDVSITSRLSTMFYLWGTAVVVDSAKLSTLNLASKTLFTSSEDSWQAEFHQGELTNDDFNMPPPDKRKSIPLAVLVQGQFPDAFEGKGVPEWPKEEAAEEESYEKPKENVALSPAPGKLVLTGCTMMFTRELFTKGGQLGFFINSIDAITLGEQLIEVRSKQQVDRSTKKISTIAKAWWRIFTTFLLPVALCVIGAFRIFMRKRTKWLYLKSLQA
ncbi:MAG: Gldg family protein [Candidatus Omnitrophota bacterium]